MRLRRQNIGVVAGLGIVACVVLAMLTGVTVPGSSAACRGDACAAESKDVTANASKRKKRRVVRTGKIIDTDTSFGDGIFNVAHGRAFCKRRERVITGGLQIINNLPGLFSGPPRTAEGESAPYLKRPGGWSVAFGSDLGGQARRAFRVVVVCERG